jgi:hypothetical protein
VLLIAANTPTLRLTGLKENHNKRRHLPCQMVASFPAPQSTEKWCNLTPILPIKRCFFWKNRAKKFAKMR